jgi:hypothetical protein
VVVDLNECLHQHEDGVMAINVGAIPEYFSKECTDFINVSQYIRMQLSSASSRFHGDVAFETSSATCSCLSYSSAYAISYEPTSFKSCQ